LVNQNTNPEYEYLFYDDSDCQAFMNKYFPQYIKHYESLIPGAYKADLFRLLVLYHHGGVYIDNKSSCILPLREIIQPDDEVHLIRDVIPECVYNGFMSSIPGHPLIKSFIDRYVSNVEQKYYGINVLDIGGPQMIGRVVNTFLGNSELSPIDSFQKDGVRLSGRIIYSSSGEDIIASDDSTTAYLERSNKSYQKRKVKDIITLKCYGTRWMMGKVYK
jgi:mannosyltransferase OCH1-like enzyme